MKKALLILLALLAFAAPALANDVAKEVNGAWQSVDNDPPSVTWTLVIQDDKLTINKKPIDIAMEKQNGMIMVRRADQQEPFLAINVVDKNTILVTNHVWGVNKKFTRTAK